MGYKDPEWLEEKYHTDGLTQKEIADLCDVSRATITRWMGKHSIDSRGTGCSQASGNYKNKAWLREKYVEEERSMSDMGGEFDVSKETIKYWLKKHDLPIRNHSDAAKLRADRQPHTIPDNTNLHPTFYRRRGYEIVSDAGNDKHVELHRLLATLEVDELSELDGMHVHHKNGIRWDNRPSNIEILTNAEHTKRHHKEGDYPQSAD